MTRNVPHAVASSSLSTSLDALETALPVLADGPWLRPTDWHELNRRLSGLRKLLASTGRPGRPRPASRCEAGSVATPATLF
ncbi:hypothetical protein [Paraburkholderia aspalathi]|uniref:hypothetical protein n=1 Tax=Paraburkholderia aspalathi TaxID=1324617 RepID=UPI0038B8AD3B